MLDLTNFIQTINEGRRKKEDVDVTLVDDVDVNKIPGATQGGKEVPVKKANQVRKGAGADENGTNQLWAIEPPVGDDTDGQQWTLIDMSKLTENQAELASRFHSEQDFLALGEAGWGKTSEITAMAHKFGYTIITVYLDKAEATDLGGIPVPVKDEKLGRSYMDYLMPTWAVYMAEHPNTKFLLFFDEMNQAADDVQNALMPIIEKKVICGVQFDNYLVGAAGNYSFENRSVGRLSKPLEKRLMPFDWEVRTPDTWRSHFEWAHKKYDSIIGPEVINETAKLSKYWNAPRDITKLIYNWAAKNKGRAFDTPKRLAQRLINGCVYEEVDTDSRTFKDDINKFAEWLINWANNDGKLSKAEDRRGRSKGEDNVDKESKDLFIDCLQKGYFLNSKANGGDGKKYLVTPENIIGVKGGGGIFDIEIFHITPEILKKIIRTMEDAGTPPKFNNNKEGEEYARKKGWEIVEFMSTDKPLISKKIKYFKDEVANED